MALTTGTRLGPYEILATIGAGDKCANRKTVGINKQGKPIYERNRKR
jgi:hypothetical protein